MTGYIPSQRAACSSQNPQYVSSTGLQQQGQQWQRPNYQQGLGTSNFYDSRSTRAYNAYRPMAQSQYYNYQPGMSYHTNRGYQNAYLQEPQFRSLNPTSYFNPYQEPYYHHQGLHPQPGGHPSVSNNRNAVFGSQAMPNQKDGINAIWSHLLKWAMEDVGRGSRSTESIAERLMGAMQIQQNQDRGGETHEGNGEDEQTEKLAEKIKRKSKSVDGFIHKLPQKEVMRDEDNRLAKYEIGKQRRSDGGAGKVLMLVGATGAEMEQHHTDLLVVSASFHVGSQTAKDHQMRFLRINVLHIRTKYAVQKEAEHEDMPMHRLLDIRFA
ncbi:unnamed protein product [Darwinula stevensoni]|uniref:Uncharacterized protein n=1 Tax=Darwinula stevensoni TaxID=69355 RepID=A0A7R8XB53_9CRUS|nr:unnamed protein product [Darwinula stevensoni]CAG0892510.1 unnamed protein product [Darwinula stevensoni]